MLRSLRTVARPMAPAAPVTIAERKVIPSTLTRVNDLRDQIRAKSRYQNIAMQFQFAEIALAACTTSGANRFSNSAWNPFGERASYVNGCDRKCVLVQYGYTACDLAYHDLFHRNRIASFTSFFNACQYLILCDRRSRRYFHELGSLRISFTCSDGSFERTARPPDVQKVGTCRPFR